MPSSDVSSFCVTDGSTVITSVPAEAFHDDRGHVPGVIRIVGIDQREVVVQPLVSADLFGDPQGCAGRPSTSRSNVISIRLSSVDVSGCMTSVWPTTSARSVFTVTATGHELPLVDGLLDVDQLEGKQRYERQVDVEQEVESAAGREHAQGAVAAVQEAEFIQIDSVVAAHVGQPHADLAVDGLGVGRVVGHVGDVHPDVPWSPTRPVTAATS